MISSRATLLTAFVAANAALVYAADERTPPSTVAARVLKAVLARRCCDSVNVSVTEWVRKDPQISWRVTIVATTPISSPRDLEEKCDLVADEAKRIFDAGHQFETRLATPEGKTFDCPIVRLPAMSPEALAKKRMKELLDSHLEQHRWLCDGDCMVYKDLPRIVPGPRQ